jgi:hypothetical protein
MIGCEQFSAAAFRAHVALRRAVTGERFATCERMAPVFADTDNRWPLAGETISAIGVPAATPETITRRGRPRRGSEAETISHRRPWLAAGLSRASWYRRQKSQEG